MMKKLIIIGILLLWPWIVGAQEFDEDDLDLLENQDLAEVKKKPAKKKIPPGGELKALEEGKRGLPSGDPRMATFEILETRYRYWQLAVRNVEMEYMIRAYQDRRYIEAMHKLDNLRRQIRLLLVH